MRTSGTFGEPAWGGGGSGGGVGAESGSGGGVALLPGDLLVMMGVELAGAGGGGWDSEHFFPT